MQDSKQIDELFRLMDAVCENGDAALPALEQYLQTQTDAPEIDTEASLKKFKADHKEFFVKPHRGRRLCYRVFVVAAAVFAAGTVFALATGHNPFDYAAMWDSETFGIFQSGHDDFETTEDGYTHFPDGTSVNYEHATDTVEYDPNAPLGSEANPIYEPVQPDPDYRYWFGENRIKLGSWTYNRVFRYYQCRFENHFRKIRYKTENGAYQNTFRVFRSSNSNHARACF